MAKALSLHLGLNVIDPVHYGSDGRLFGCINDAKDMVKLAKKRGFTPKMLIDGQATVQAVSTAIKDAAKALKAGDFFFITYSGHGSQVPDKNGDEKDKQDETWCLFDRMIVDDELAALWAGFKAGVRILVLSDSCHSGSVTRTLFAAPAIPQLPRGQAARLLPPDQAAKTYKQSKKVYDKVQKDTPGEEKTVIKASVLLISGCQDNQVSIDNGTNGVFTMTLSAVLKKGFPKGYKRLRDLIAAKMLPSQSPNYYVSGKQNPAFEQQEVLSV